MKNEVMDIVALSEGSCPDCGKDVKITSIGGNPAWLYGKQLVQCTFNLRGMELNAWLPEPRDKFSNLGCVTGECQGCGKSFYTEQTQGGDWTN